MQLNSIFQQANESRERYRVFMGSAGSGKSVNIAANLILRLQETPGANLLVVRSIDATNKASTFAELSNAIDQLGLSSRWESKQVPLQLMCKDNGNLIMFRGCKDESAREKIKSITVPKGHLTWVWIEEASELTADDFNLIDDRLRGQLPPGLFYQITLSLNPTSPESWIKKQLWDMAETDPNIHICHSTYLDNAFIDQQFKDRAERIRQLSPDWYRIYYLGEWGELEGIIVTELHKKDLTEARNIAKPYVCGVYYGFNRECAAVLVGRDDNDRIYVIHEIHGEDWTPKQLAKKMLEDKMIEGAKVFIENDPDKLVINPLKAAGINISNIKPMPPSTKAGYLRLCGVIVSNRSPITHKELSQYRYKKDPVFGGFLDEPMEHRLATVEALNTAVSSWYKATGIRTYPKELFGL